MRFNIWNKHIPTLLGLSIIVIGIAATSYLVKSGTIFEGLAEESETPLELKITNTTDSSFTVSYYTADSVIGSVNYGVDTSLGNTAFDEKDQENESVELRKIHSITVSSLNPETEYFFTISSGKNTFLNNTNPFSTSTGPTLENQTDQRFLKGTVLFPGGDPVKNGFVFATADNAQIISTTLDNEGNYELQISSLRTNDLTAYYPLTDNMEIKLLVDNGEQKSNVTVSALQNTVPTITLSYDYDFTLSKEPVATSSARISGFESIPVQEEVSVTSSPEITLPRENQGFVDQQPEFNGKALPNEEVTIIIHSEENIEETVTADSFGNWSFRPSQSLAPGQHTITIITRDAFGVLRSITQPFVVYAQGTQVNQTATPSATPTLAFPTGTQIPTPTSTSQNFTPTPILPGTSETPTPTGTSFTASPTPTPILIVQNFTPTPTPLINTSLTSIPTPTLCPGCPSPTPTPFVISLSPTSEVNLTVTITPPGDSSVLTIGILGIATTAIGFLLFLLTRSGI